MNLDKVRPRKCRFRQVCAGIIMVAALWKTAQADAADLLNVLFIVADDQNTRLGCYGDNFAFTPNLDRLANEGVLFRNAYCQQAICGPSRASFLTGLRTDALKVYDLKTTVRQHRPHVMTLPQDFKNRGYFTQSIGKIFHPGVDDPQSWSTPSFPGPEVVGSTSETSGTMGGLPDVTPGRGGKRRGPSWFAPDLPDDKFHDGVITDEAIRALRSLKEQPFFLAVGYNRPHLPFVAPKEYFDRFNAKQMPVVSSVAPLAGVPDYAFVNMGELRQYRDIPSSGSLSLEKVRELTVAYYACSSFVDAQVGRLLEELKNLNLDSSTIVVFLGDHGFHLGENGTWAKNTNFEVATRSPLILRVPDRITSGPVEAIVEFIDIYPTLAELCGWIPEGVHGKSLAAHLSGPGIDNQDGTIKSSAIDDDEVALSRVNRKDSVGYSLRTKQHRYTEWRAANGDIVGREFYEYNEGDGIETENLADAPKHKAQILKMQQKINQLLALSTSKR